MKKGLRSTNRKIPSEHINMTEVNKTTVISEVIDNINAKYGIEQGITDDFRTMMLSALSQCYL